MQDLTPLTAYRCLGRGWACSRVVWGGIYSKHQDAPVICWKSWQRSQGERLVQQPVPAVTGPASSGEDHPSVHGDVAQPAPLPPVPELAGNHAAAQGWGRWSGFLEGRGPGWAFLQLSRFYQPLTGFHVATTLPSAWT